jgi:hypothetical protein
MSPVELWIDLCYTDSGSVDFREMTDKEVLDRILSNLQSLKIPVNNFKVVHLLGSKRAQMMWHFVTGKVCVCSIHSWTRNKRVYARRSLGTIT